METVHREEIEHLEDAEESEAHLPYHTTLTTILAGGWDLPARMVEGEAIARTTFFPMVAAAICQPSSEQAHLLLSCSMRIGHFSSLSSLSAPFTIRPSSKKKRIFSYPS